MAVVLPAELVEEVVAREGVDVGGRPEGGTPRSEDNERNSDDAVVSFHCVSIPSVPAPSCEVP